MINALLAVIHATALFKLLDIEAFAGEPNPSHRYSAPMHTGAPVQVRSAFPWLTGAVFMLGILIPTLVGVTRWWGVGLRNSAWFGDAPEHPIDLSTDSTMLTVAFVMTGSLLALAVLTVVQLLRGGRIRAGVGCILLGLVPVGLCWWIIAS